MTCVTWNQSPAIAFACEAYPYGRGSLELRKYQDYLRHAAECREMARTAPPSHRLQLEQMADVWEELAEARKRKLDRLGLSPNDDTAEIE